MEAIRSDVDAWLLDFVINRVFSMKDFYEKKDGGIRLSLKITPILAETIPLWTKEIETVIEQVKVILLNHNSPT
jgi:hypothetical protein